MLFMYNFKRYFNPRSPHGERRMTAEEAARLAISIHAPRTGSDRRKPRRKRRQSSFQSTLPARGATDLPATRHLPFVISIHAPRTGSDPADDTPAPERTISIHAPRTGSDIRTLPKGSALPPFQSTLPARGATTQPRERRRPQPISIHAPRTGSDGNLRRDGSTLIANFNPRSPHGERRSQVRQAAFP